MNQIGRQAQEHWRRWLPTRYAALDDPTGFFENLGQEAQERIEEVASDLAGDDPPGETYLAKVGRLRMARLQATELVLRELLPDPETGEPAPTTASGADSWIPLTEDPSHPFWRGQEDVEG
jgi:hypothetical protein